MESKKGVLLVNLGSPDSTEIKDVKRYLDEFLMDERVIDVPYLLRAMIVRGFILPFRPKKSAEAYRSIWWDEGSPLIVLTRRLLEKVNTQTELPVSIGMRYGNPSIKSGIEDLIRKEPELKEFLLVPLYPHYAMSSYESVVVKAEEVIAEHFPDLSMTTHPAFYNNDDYNQVLADLIRENLPDDYDHILFSYHGLPVRHLRKSDPTGSHCMKTQNCCSVDSEAHATCYRHQVLKTTEFMAERLNLEPGTYSTTFQSRLKGDKWLSPYTDTTLEEFPTKGVKKLAVVCPAFVSDCLETIEEIGDEGKEIFLEAGGEEFTLIPCLNDDEKWVSLLAKWIAEFKNSRINAESVH